MPSTRSNSVTNTHEYSAPDHFDSLSRLGDDITQMAAHLDAGTFQLLELIGKFDEMDGWHGIGIQSCAHWLNWKCGISMGAAREKVRVARALPGLSDISDAFREGRVSYSKVRAMTRVATAKNEDALLQIALGGTASHVETQVSLYRKTKRIEALQEENLRHAHRALSWYIDDGDSFILKGRFTAEQGTLLKKALEAAGDQLFEEQQHVSEEVSAETSSSQPIDQLTPQPIDQLRADALERILEGFLASSENGRPGGARYMVNLHTNIETLKKDGTGAESELEDQAHVSAETSRRMACDCSKVHWLEGNKGEPLNIGRKTRSIPPAIRRALQRRDAGCRFPGCTCKRYVDAHHIRHWADGGETSMENLVLLCRSHHRLVHESGYGVHRNLKEAIHFTLPDGKKILPGPDTRFRGNVVAIEAANQRNGLNITPKTSIPEWYGDSMDPEMAVDMLLVCE